MVSRRSILLRAIGKVVSTLDGALFAPAHPARLAGSRVVLGAYTLWYLGARRRMLAGVHRTDPDLFEPVGPVRGLRRPVPPRVADALVDAELLASAAFTLGVGHRLSGPLHAALLLWTVSYRNSWSMIFHSDNALVLHTLVAGCTRSADTWSLDARLRAARGMPVPVPHWRYGYPTHVASAVTTLVYLLSGIAKVSGPLGWGWARGEALRSQVAADGLRKEVLGASAAPLGVALYPRTGVWTLAGVGSLAIELGAPLALLHPALGRLWAGAALGMHWGIKALMGITFRYQLSGVAYSSFVPWEQVARAVRRRLSTRPGLNRAGR